MVSVFFKIHIFFYKKDVDISFFCILFFFLIFNFTILYWFCHISTWIGHRYTRVPHPEPSSLLPPRTIPLGSPSAPAPSIQDIIYKECINQQFILLVRLPVNSRLLVKFWMSQKLNRVFQLHGELVTLTPMLFNHQLYLISVGPWRSNTIFSRIKKMNWSRLILELFTNDFLLKYTEGINTTSFYL